MFVAFFKFGWFGSFKFTARNARTMVWGFFTNNAGSVVNFDQKPHFWGLYWAAKVNKFISELIKTTKVKDNPPIYEFKSKIQNLKLSFEFHAADRNFEKFSNFHKNFTFSRFNSRGPINLFLTKILHFDRLFVVIFGQLTDRKLKI